MMEIEKGSMEDLLWTERTDRYGHVISASEHLSVTKSLP